MPIIRVTPKGCVDAVYSRMGQAPMDMAQLANLVPAPDTINQWVPKPAAVQFGASTAAFTVASIIVGTRLYGMRKSITLGNFDEPFCFDLLANAYVTITGATNANTPANAVTTGAWQPPHMEVIGVKIIVTHKGFSGAGANFFGVINISNLAAVTWTAANTATNALPSVPVWVSQFNQRAFFFCNPTNAQPAVLATDVLSPDTRSATVAAFILTFNDNIPLLCGGTLGVSNQLGGIIQALMVFKIEPSNIFQITGDFASASSTLAALQAGAQTGVTGQQLLTMNTLNVATGTLAPNSVTQTPKGLAFLAPDGWRIIDFDAHVSDPIGLGGTGISVPFINAVQPSRIAAACNATTLRASTQNGAAVGSPQQEWCYDLVRDSWYGPNTFPVSLIETFGNSFIITPTPSIGAGGIWQSDLIPNSGSVYTENGAGMNCVYQTALFPDRSNIDELSCTTSVLYLGYGSGNTTFSISAQDENGNVVPGGFGSFSFVSAPIVWGGFNWGSGQSLGSVSQIAGYSVAWTQPLIFDRISVTVQVTANPGVRLGSFYMDVEQEEWTVIP